MDETKELKIQFHFHPNDQAGPWYVEKEEGGRKRRYLEGISSGVNMDGAGERMTEKAINSFHEQANRGDVLLYAGKHGIDYTEDIGRLMKSEILPNGDWKTVYRLYDDGDGFAPGSSTMEKCEKVWRQVNGLPPYTKPKQKGFSIEGIIPDGGLQTVDGTGKRVMNGVDLDAVVLVSRPAYKDSIARAVYKALNLVMPCDMKNGLSESIKGKAVERKTRSDYYDSHYSIQSALDEKVQQIMATKSPERADQLRTLFGEYSDLMVDLIMGSEAMFDEDPQDGATGVVQRALDHRTIMVRQLRASATILEKALQYRGRTVGLS